MVRVFDISQRMLDECDVAPVEQIFDELEKDREMVRMLQGNVGFRLAGEEEKGITQWFDPVVGAWGRAVYGAVPHLLYYMYPERGLPLVLAAFAGPERLQGSTEEELSASAFELQLGAFSVHLTAAAGFAVEMADDWRPIVGRLIEGLSPELAKAVLETVEASLTLESEVG